MSGHTTLVDTEEFRRVYRTAATDVMRFVAYESQLVVARHNLGLHPDAFDLGAYLAASEVRYVRALDLLNQNATFERSSLSALDVGGFLAAFPLALARLGVPTTLVEEYDYYYGAFDGLRDFLAAEGLRIWSVDFTDEIEDVGAEQQTFVTNMAMVEHLAASPKVLLANLNAATAPSGLLILEVPNLAYWPKRLVALRGGSVHPPLKTFYETEPPFLGHQREYTRDELVAVLGWAGFDVRDVDLFNCSLNLRAGRFVDRAYAFLVYAWPTLLFPACREVIMACASPEPRPDKAP